MSVINHRVFEEHQFDLIQASGAIEHVVNQVYSILNKLPEDLKGEFDEKIEGIANVCACISRTAKSAAHDAEEWAAWAKSEKLKVHFKM